jgi:hypothetical protein
VDLFRKEGWPFIGGRGSTKDGLGRPGHRACRLWEGQGVALARSGHVQWCWGDVGDVMAWQGDEGERERSSGQRWGVRVALLPSSESQGRGLGREDRGSIVEHSRRGRDTVGRTERGLATGPCTILHLCRFLPTMCSTKCPHEIKF